MYRHKADETAGYIREWDKTIGYLLWLITIVIGLAGWHLWKWYALPISIGIAVLLSNLYSIIEAKQRQNRADLNIDGQEMAFSESALGSLAPILRDPEEYRAFIDSLPDDQPWL